MELIEILHEPTDDEPFVVVNKPSALPSAPISKDDDCALFRVAKVYPQVLEVKGKKEIEGGLIHRIDNDTSGLLLIACSQEFYDGLMEIQNKGEFFKEYTAECIFLDVLKMMDGYPEKKDFASGKLFLSENLESFLKYTKKYTVSSYFRPFGLHNSSVRPVTSSCGKAALKKKTSREYVTEISLNHSGDSYIAKCRINLGYRHQVRCHLAWIGFPIKGDRIYNPMAAEGQKMEFYATGLEFVNPLNGKKMYFNKGAF